MIPSILEKPNHPALASWCAKHRIDWCILFGSGASGKMHPRSDVDLAIYSEMTALIDLKLQLIGELEDLLQAEIDLTIWHGDMSPLLMHEIMTKGKPLFVSNRDILIEKQIYAIKMYENYPFLTKYQELALRVNLERLKNVTRNYLKKSADFYKCGIFLKPWERAMQKLTVILFTLLFACQSAQEKPVVNTWDCEVFPPEHRIETDSVSGAKIIYATTDTSKDLNFYFDLNSWTADLRLLVFFSNRTGQNELFGYLAPTGEIVRLQSPAQPVAFNATVDYQSPDIYVVRENQIFQWHLDISLATAEDQRSSVKISEYFIAKAPEGRSFFMGLTESGDGKFLSAGLNRADSDLQDIVSIEIETGKITTLYTAKHISHVQFNKYNPNLLRFSHWPQRMWYIDVRQPGKAFPLHHQEAGELVTHEDWWVNDQMTFCGGNRPEHAHLKVVDLHTQVTRIIGAGSWWEGGTPRELSRYNWWHCSGSRDGRWVATDNWHGNIAISDARTAHLRLLTTDHRTYGNVGVEHPHVGWAPDSKSVEFTSHKLGNANVCLAFLPEAWENPFQQVPEPSVAAQQE